MDRSAITVGPGMDMPIMHDNDRYELVRDIGSGNFGVARLMRDRQTDELVAVKYIERGDKVCCCSRLFFFLYLFNQRVSLPRLEEFRYRVVSCSGVLLASLVL